MAASKYVSDIKFIDNNNEVVYNFLSDFNNLGKFFNEYTLAQISQQIPNASIEDVTTDADHCKFTISKVGEAGFAIIERDSPKMIKVRGEGKIPFQLFFWIQILHVSEYKCKIRLTLHAELNMMMKMLVGKKLNEGINHFAEALTKFPYQ